MFKRIPEYEQYLFEPIKEVAEIPQVLQEMKQDSEKLTYLLGTFEKKRIGGINSIKDPNNYNGPGVINSFDAVLDFAEEMKHIDEIFPEKYELKYRGYTITVHPDRLKAVGQYTVDWCTEALRGLYFIHGRDAESYLKRKQEVLDTARKTFGNF